MYFIDVVFPHMIDNNKKVFNDKESKKTTETLYKVAYINISFEAKKTAEPKTKR